MEGPEAHRILVVEDQPVLRELLAQILRRSGFTVDSAADGAAARLLLNGAVPYDLMVTDLHMPHVGGLELLAGVREDRLPLEAIVISGLLTPSIAERAAELGAFAVLSKPFDLEELLRSVRSALAHGRAPR